jgi:hypothetical protein
MAQTGTIRDVRPALRDGRLKIVAQVVLSGGEQQEAFLPDRELSALLPRSLLAGERKEVPDTLLTTIQPILRRLVAGREVRLWEYRSDRYCSFPSWRSVRFDPP